MCSPWTFAYRLRGMTSGLLFQVEGRLEMGRWEPNGHDCDGESDEIRLRGTSDDVLDRWMGTGSTGAMWGRARLREVVEIAYSYVFPLFSRGADCWRLIWNTWTCKQQYRRLTNIFNTALSCVGTIQPAPSRLNRRHDTIQDNLQTV